MKCSFNKSQSKAISHEKGPAMILAGPGSGKTLVVTQRVKNLIEKENIAPEHILVITFTKAAATEMKQRFLDVIGESKSRVTFGTFHAVFFTILKYAYHYTAANVIKEEQKYQFLREIVAGIQVEYEDEGEFLTNLLSEISLVKNEGIAVEYYYAKNCGEDIFREIFRKYETKLQRARLLDFDDMLVYTYELLKERKDILALWQKQFSHILIDEFQDINQLQYEIIKMMAEPKNNLFIVGDDDQSIYRFRGAKPEIMLRFKKDYQNVKEILLNINYRSTGNIMKRAGNLISYNQSRFIKEIESQKEAGEDVVFQIHKNQWEEGEAVIENIKKQLKNGVSYSQIAVLYRTNTQPRILIEQLMNYNIPFVTKDRIPNIYEHWITKDIITYLQIAQGSRNRQDFLKIMNRPKRYIGRESLEESMIAFEIWEQYYKEQPWIAERIERLEYDVRMLSGMKPYAAMNYIRHGIGYDDFIKEYANYRHMKEEDLLEILDELQESAKEYQSYDAWFLHMEEYKEELEEQAKRNHQQTDGIALATLHSAKGLEYEVVYIVDVNEGIMPYKKAVLDQELEEERRMFYVGMTRAKKELYLSSIKEQNGRNLDISRFIKEAGI